MKSLRRLFWAYCLLLPLLAGAATVYGPGSGLPNLSVRAMVFDPEGYLWLGTEDGVFRFDGHRFEPLPLTSPGVPLDTYVSTMLATPRALYVATRTGLHRYDWHAQRAQLLRDTQGAELRGLLSLATDASGRLLAGSDSGRVLQFLDRMDTQASTLLVDEQLGWILNLQVVEQYAWMATSKGVFKLDLHTATAQPLRFTQAQLDNGARYARSVLEYPRGVLWIGFWNDGLLRLDLVSAAQRWFHPAQDGAGALRATSIYALAPHGARVYIASNRGLVYYDSACDCLLGLNHPDWDKLDGTGVIIDTLALQGDAVWAGQVANGVYRFSAEDRVFEHQVKVDGRGDSLAAPSVRALHVGHDGRLWLGGYAGVQWVDSAHRQRGQRWPWQSLPWALPRAESRFVWSIEQDPAQDLWIGTGAGMYRQQGTELQSFTPAIESSRCSLLRQGRRYVGSVFGLFRLEGNVLRAVPLADKGASQPPVWSLTEFEQELWVGTANGLYRLDTQDQLIAHHGIGLGPTELPGSLVLQQRSTPDGRVWQVTSGGLVEVQGDASRRLFARQPALLAAQVRNPLSIETDAQGRIWLGTPRGLVRYHPTRGQVDIFDRSDGLVSDQLSVNASANDGQRLHFGSVGGLISFDPVELTPRLPGLSPRVTRRRIGQGPWQSNQGELLLPPDHAPLQLELSAQHYRWPERVRYAYRWADSESTFTELGDARTALFSHLPSGTHVLELRAQLDSPLQAQATAQVMQVRVTYAWHQTWWGRVLLAGGLLLSIYLWVAWRSRAAREQQRLLERLVAQRTQQLRDASSAMEAANARLQELASIDPLTGLANRRELFEQARLWQESGALLAVLMLDVDHFKQINDRYGHEAGDAVLKQFAALLRELSTAQTGASADRILCSRYGGEEFTCLLSGALAQTVEHYAQRVLAMITQQRFRVDASTEIQVTASIGCALGSPGESLESVIRRADAALYRVKSSGRANWQAG